MYPAWLFIVLDRILYKYYLASKKITSTILGQHMYPHFFVFVSQVNVPNISPLNDKNIK